MLTVATNALCGSFVMLIEEQANKNIENTASMADKNLFVFNLGLLILASVTLPIQLQPMPANMKTIRTTDILELLYSLQAIKIITVTTIGACEKMLMLV